MCVEQYTHHLIENRQSDPTPSERVRRNGWEEWLSFSAAHATFSYRPGLTGRCIPMLLTPKVGFEAIAICYARYTA